MGCQGAIIAVIHRPKPDGGNPSRRVSIKPGAIQSFGWLKVVGGGRKLRYIGVKRNQLWADLATAAYNLVRLGNLVAEAA